MLNLFLDFLFPKRCVGCKRTGEYFCKNCRADIKQTDLVCPFCERLSLGGMVHPVCKRKYGLDGLWSLGVYEPPLKSAIQKLKYKWIKSLADILIDITLEYWAIKGTFLLDQIKKSHGKNWVAVPVPLHKSRENWRGFNQSALLAGLFASKLGLNYADSLKRIRKTKPQVGLEAYKRRENIKGAFILNKNFPIKDLNILLIDDVWTTGSTLRECGNILKRRGVKSVWALTLAR
jgi:competence protein ComFC